MGTSPRTSIPPGRLVIAAFVLGSLAAGPAHALRPIVFVHGWHRARERSTRAQAMRFASNGYPAELRPGARVRLALRLTSQAQVVAALDVLVDQVLAETGADKVDLLGHSLGTAHLAGLPEQSPRGPPRSPTTSTSTAPPRPRRPGGVPTLAIWGHGNPARQIVGAENVYSPEPDARAGRPPRPESFAAQYEFLNGAPPATTDILPEPRVQLAGRAVIFPQNLGVDDATLRDLRGRRRHRRAAAPGPRRHLRALEPGRRLRAVRGDRRPALRVRASCATARGRTTSTPSRSYAATS